MTCSVIIKSERDIMMDAEDRECRCPDVALCDSSRILPEGSGGQAADALNGW